MKKHSIRIVGGDYRRTPIPVIDAAGLRPTPDRVRETLYNWLHYFWDGRFSDKRVLDLFAGTGALGFEAASRGVAHVQMVESRPEAVAALRQLRTRLNANQVRIHAGDARTVLARLNATPFDLVLLDPPFGQDWLGRLWPALPAIMAPEALVYVESEEPATPPDTFDIIRRGKAGAVHFHLLRFAASQKTGNNSKSEPIQHPDQSGHHAPASSPHPEPE
jgi:16S rRNA (guanine(966)-N(2))-methyltransferase RsmD